MGENAEWLPSEPDLRNMTPLKVRDLLVECFYETRSADFARILEKQGKAADPETLRRVIRGVIRSVFREAGEDFDAPTSTGLQKAIQVLASRSAFMGTSPETISRNRENMMRLVRSL